MLEAFVNRGSAMKANGSARRVLYPMFLASLIALPGCVQPRVQQPAANDSASSAADPLAVQLESLQRYAAQMEELYAAQEAEILRLREQVANLNASQNQ
jgi:hypothetical protein